MLVCGLLLVHCGSEDFPTDLNQREQAIINGTVDTGYPGVGALIIDLGGGNVSMCSGVSVAQDWILTAAHCVADAEASNVMFTDDPDINYAFNFYFARELHPHEAYVPPDGVNPPQNNIALVELVGFQGAVYSYNTDGQAVVSGLDLTWVGYGVNAYPPSGGGIKRRGNGQIDSVGGAEYYYLYDGVLPCSGDSGGPAFAQIGGGQKVVGIIIGGDENCSQGGMDIRVDTYKDWIADKLASGQEEPQPDADGGVSDAGSDAGVDAGDGTTPDSGTVDGAAQDADAGSGSDAPEDGDGPADGGQAEDQDVTDAGQDEPITTDDQQPTDTSGTTDEENTDGSGGCSCSVPQSKSSLALIGLLILGLYSSKRRRRP